MSSVLNRKKKRMQPREHGKMEHMAEAHWKQKREEKLVQEACLNLKLIAYQILHDKFSFGQKRIRRLDEEIETCLKLAADGGLSERQLEDFLKEKCKIDAQEEANKIPFRETFFLLDRWVPPKDRLETWKLLNATAIVFFHAARNNP